MSAELVRLTVRCDPHAPGIVREAISRVAGLGRPAVTDAVLIASELVTNAVRHSLCSEDELLTVRVSRDGWLRISVVDPGRSGAGAEIAHRPVGLGGMGLKVVSDVALRWGAERRPDGYEVWADVALAA